MGVLLNPGNTGFEEAINSEIYVDKTQLIAFTNKNLKTKQKNICISRPRRFGKSMAADMLVAYYSKGCDSKELFSNLKIAEDKSFEKHLNKYNVIHLGIQRFLRLAKNDVSQMVDFLDEDILDELMTAFPNVKKPKRLNAISFLENIFAQIGEQFIFVIDEWDQPFRKKKSNGEMTVYLDYLRDLLKDQDYCALAYMTGILSIKKYGEHSALNMFQEYSMTNQRELAEFTGFTENEVRILCEKYDMDFSETKKWYDGYNLKGLSIYNPRSVVMSMTGHDYDNYWTSTETYEALKDYIKMDFDGLKEKVTKMIAGERIPINTRKFQNDMTTFSSADDVLTLLIHLGYLTYDFATKTTWIPNNEVQDEFINSIEDGGWEEVMSSIRKSDELLQATLDMDQEKVAGLIAQSHMENSSILQYNDENSLACVISLAYYSAKNKYIMHRELATGKGFADIVYIPRKNVDLPALVIELKYNQSAETAIEQIKNKNYTKKIKEYSGEILLIGINYDKDKNHTCMIEKITK